MAINFIIDKTEMREGYDRIIPIWTIKISSYLSSEAPIRKLTVNEYGSNFRWKNLAERFKFR